MKTAEALIGTVTKTMIYVSVIGKIYTEQEILDNGKIHTSIFVKYPDGVAEEVDTIHKAVEKLEIE